MIRAVRTIAAHELYRLVVRKEIIVFGLVLPVIIITLVGLTFGSTGSIEVGLLDRDGSAKSADLLARFDDLDGVTVRTYHDPKVLRRDVRTTAIQAGVVIPDGYGDAVAAGDAAVQVVVDPTSEGVASALATIDAAVSAEGIHEGAVQLVAEELPGGDAVARRAVDEQQARLEPVSVIDDDRGEDNGSGSFSYTAPANLVLFVFINTFAVSTVIAIDRKEGMLRRLLSTPTSSTAILLGMGLSKLIFAVTQSTLIIAIGTAAFGVEWGDPVAAAVLVVVFAAIATTVGVLVGASVGDADQAQAVGIPLAVGCGMLGGCMWPLQIVPRAMQLVGHLTPHAWAMDAWGELVFDGASLGDILPNLAILSGAALVLGLLAARQLRRAVTA